MPKESASSFVWRMKETYPTELCIKDDCTLFCIPCKFPINYNTIFQVKQHLDTGKHKRNVERNRTIVAQTTEALSPSPSESTSADLQQFHRDFFKMLRSENILISQISTNQNFAEFIQKYTPYSLPSESTLRHICVSTMYEKCMHKLKLEASDAYIWVSLSETTDAQQENIVNFVFGILGKKGENKKSYLLNIAALNTMTRDKIATFFTDSLRLIWPNGLKNDKVLLVITDAAPYMRDAMLDMIDDFPKMIHVNCLALDLHQLSECVRIYSADVDVLISRVASIFDQKPSHRHDFRETNPNAPLPPASMQYSPRCTWIEAAIYYAKHFKAVKATIDGLNSNGYEGIKEASNAFLSPTVQPNLASIQANFNSFVDAINAIQKRGIPLTTSIDHIDRMYEPIAAMKFPTFRSEFERLLKNNPGYAKLKSIDRILSLYCNDFDECEHYTAEELAMYANAPITMCDVESTFTAYKSVVSNSNVSPDQLKEHVTVYCNDSLFETFK